MSFVAFVCWAMLTSGYPAANWQEVRLVCPVEVASDETVAIYMGGYVP